ncbi:hypothetical protein ACRCD7_05460 [Aliarcobacter sp. ERUVET-7]|uniref:hypothetical protein n=1 Tax=Aliarcobacter sp. ERUVET-7 TaxID=3429683 RepID=UPI003D6A373D
MDNLSIIAIAISVFSSVFSLLTAIYTAKATNQTKQNAKENFKNNLREKINSIKYEIMKIEQNKFNHRENMIFIESIRDKMMYQQYEEEKAIYLDKKQNGLLSELQEEIEDMIGFLLKTKDETYEQNILDKINSFMQKI